MQTFHFFHNPSCQNNTENWLLHLNRGLLAKIKMSNADLSIISFWTKTLQDQGSRRNLQPNVTVTCHDRLIFQTEKLAIPFKHILHNAIRYSTSTRKDRMSHRLDYSRT
uniref:Uncharacterized protein n=1 Tax=Anguilla anguilla TaxID=7936 RepID=A0A0E9WVH8_ANGAN